MMFQKKTVCAVISVFFAVILLFGSVTCVFAETGEGQNETPQTASPINVNQTYSDKIASSGDIDYYRVTLSSAGMLKVTFTHTLIDSTEFYWTISIFNSDLTNIGITYVRGKPSSASTPEIGVPAGTYYVKIYKSDSYPRYHSAEQYSFCVNFTASPYWEKEVNPAYDSASQITLTDTFKGAIVSENDVDFYRFTSDKDGVIHLQFTHDMIDSTEYYWTAILLNSDLESICTKYFTGKNTSEYMPEIGLPAGTYFLKVYKSDSYPRYHSNLTYALNLHFTASDYWEKELNNTLQTASGVTVNKEYAGSICVESDQDYYKFTLNNAGAVQIRFHHEIIDSTEKYWTVILYNTDGDMLTQRFIGGKEKDVSLCETGVPAGTYYIKIYKSDSYPRYHSKDTYRFQVVYTASNQWEREVNNGYQTATPLATDAGIWGSVSYESDEDYYSFTLSGSKTVQINLQHPLIDSNEVYWTIVLYNSSLNALNTFHVRGRETNYVSADVTLSAGKYYVKVRKSDSYPRYHSGENYCLRIGESGLMGDVDFNGAVTAADARLALRAAVMLENFSEKQKRLGDVDHDGSITASDARLILRAAVGLETLK